MALLKKLPTGKTLEAKDLHVNMTKTKVFCTNSRKSGSKKSEEFSFGIRHFDVGSNPILCFKCKYWIHKCCIIVKDILKQIRLESSAAIQRKVSARTVGNIHLAWTNPISYQVDHRKLETIELNVENNDFIT